MKDIPALYFYVGRRIREVREANLMTQEKLAELIGHNRSSLSMMEGGKHGVYLETIYKIALALNVSPGELLPPITKRMLQTKEQAFLDFLAQDTEKEAVHA